MNSDHNGNKTKIKQTIDTKVDSFNAGVEEEGKISEKVRKYAKGETVFTEDGQKFTLDKMTSKQLKQFEDLIGTLGNESSSQFGEYLDGTFGK